MTFTDGYKLVQVASGAFSVHSIAHRETFHPVVGPALEAESLYARQLRLAERMSGLDREFVIWDVGLGAAANALAALRVSSGEGCPVRLVSFDHTIEPLQFALRNTDSLPYLRGFEGPLEALIRGGQAEFRQGRRTVAWELVPGDFPAFLQSPKAQSLPKPDAILYDAFSPAKNPAMWTLPVFSNLAGLLDTARPCNLATYSRSTLLRVTLLLAGWRVGCGHATGEKEETTIAASSDHLVETPLDQRWLLRVRASSSAEPMLEPVYRQAPLSAPYWAALCAHPQFNAARSPALSQGA